MKRTWLIEKKNSLRRTRQNVADNSKVIWAYYTMIEQGLRNPSVASSKTIADTLNFK